MSSDGGNRVGLLGGDFKRHVSEVGRAKLRANKLKRHVWVDSLGSLSELIGDTFICGECEVRHDNFFVNICDGPVPHYRSLGLRGRLHAVNVLYQGFHACLLTLSLNMPIKPARHINAV